MRVQDTLQELSEIVCAGKISTISKDDLERYSLALCFSGAPNHFSGQQFTQVCETIRLLLLKEYTEETNKKHIFLQYIVIFLALCSLTGTAFQVLPKISKWLQKPESIMQESQLKKLSTPIIRAPK